MEYKEKEELKADADRCIILLLGVEKALKDLAGAIILAKQRLGRLETKIDKIEE